VSKRQAEIRKLQHSINTYTVGKQFNVALFVKQASTEEFKALSYEEKKVAVELFVKNRDKLDSIILELEEKLKKYAVKTRT